MLFFTMSFMFIVWIKPATLSHYLPNYYQYYLVASFGWIVISLLTGKYRIIKEAKRKASFRKVFLINAIFCFSVFAVIHFGNLNFHSRLVIYGTIISTSLFDFALMWIVYLYSISVNVDQESITKRKKIVEQKRSKYYSGLGTRAFQYNPLLKDSLESVYSADVLSLLNSYADIQSPLTMIFKSDFYNNIDYLEWNKFSTIINLERINNIRFINKYFESANSKLQNGNYLIGCAETYEQRKFRLLRKFPIVLNYVYYSFDFVLKRLFPKFNITKQIYFALTKGRNRVLSRAEVLGRLYSCGFKVVQEKEIDNILYFVAQKQDRPYFDMNPTYGPLISLNRRGKDGKMFKVYKLRTMHPYSEYLQEYVYHLNNLQDGGKFKDDFRITSTGKFARKVWLDELPMIWNFFKGNMKLVGVRPLSNHYYNLYSEETRQLRKKVKPGLVPPFYVDNPKTLNEIQESEIRYINAYLKKPFATDFTYFWKAVYNITIKKARSN